MKTPAELSDEELLSLFREDHPAAFLVIYQRYDKPLYLYAYHKLGNKEEARDIVHDVFAWLLKNRQTLDLKLNLPGYLYKATLNKIFNIYKHRQVIRKYVDSGEYYIDAEPAETDFLIREKDIAAMIEREIAAMPPGMRTVYELRNKRYLSTKEVAQELSIAESTVHTQMRRAMKHLKLKLGILTFMVFLAGSL